MTTDLKQDTPRRVAQALLNSGIADQLAARQADISPNAQVVLKRRYLSKDREGNILEDIPGMFTRVAHNLSKADLNYDATEQDRAQTEEKFLNAMTRLEVLPNSPTLMNAGRELQQLSACFVLPVEDSLDDIFNEVKRTALIHKSGGGTGFAFSRLRPEGAPVGSTGGVASGPVSFIRAFDTATDVVKQGGTRRGANMGILHVTHPDILKFINSKKDGQHLQNFNISVAATNDFMDRVKRNEEYFLLDPNTKKQTGALNAKDVFDQIVELTWLTGDPGLVFIDRINEGNPNPQLGRIESTNPCFPGDVRLATDKGLLTFEELYRSQSPIQVATDARVMDIREEMRGNAPLALKTIVDQAIIMRQAVPVFLTRKNWPVFHLETTHGYSVTATEDHEFFTPSGSKKLYELNEGDEILIQPAPGHWSTDYKLPTFNPNDKLRARIERGEAGPPTVWSRDIGILLGWTIADGWISQEKPKGRHRPNSTLGLIFGSDEEREIGYQIEDNISRWFDIKGTHSERNNALTIYFKATAAQFLMSLGVKPVKSTEKTVPESIWKAPREAVLGFLQAIFTADGTVSLSSHYGTCSIRLAASNKPLLQQVQLLLLNEGVVSKLYLRREAGQKALPDSNRELKVYNAKAQYELVIDGHGRNAFARNIGFLTPGKNAKLNDWIAGITRPNNRQETYTDTVSAITPAGCQDVYCTTEEITNSIIANGFTTSQCGEQPLLPYESCNLASINLARMTTLRDGIMELDEDLLAETVRTTVHMLDNVIDMNQYPIPEIAAMTRKTRRIGLGVMGLADMLIQMGVRYDSQEALDITRYTMRKIREMTHEASASLAAQRGSFPEWERSIYGPDWGPGLPMRNSAPTTVAPTGTISIIANTSSGIEPLYALAYERNVMDNTRLLELNPTLKALAQSEGFDTPEFNDTLARTGSVEATNAPDWVKNIFRTSHQIAPDWHVRMQAAAQDHVDNAVSKTINFPHEATPEDIAKAYMMAYDLGCKGITAYRDGSKENQVLSTPHEQPAQADGQQQPEQRGQETPQHTPRERPRHMSGITERVITGHGNMYVTVNHDENGMPFEVFGNLGKAGGCDSAQLEAITRLVSLALRSNIPTSEIIDQLRGITCCPAWDNGVAVKSSPDAVALVLERDLAKQPSPNGHEPAQTTVLQMKLETQEARELVPLLSRTKCPDCNGFVKYQEGCLTCESCGFSKCE